MARDLIPPPSPAGRPDPDAGKHQTFSESTLLRTDAEHDAAVEAETPLAPAEGGSRYKSRFGFLLGALVGVGVAAMIVIALVIAGLAADPVSSLSASTETAGRKVGIGP